MRPIYRLGESSGTWCSKQFRYESHRDRIASPDECIMHAIEPIVGLTDGRGSNACEEGVTYRSSNRGSWEVVGQANSGSVIIPRDVSTRSCNAFSTPTRTCVVRVFVNR